MKSAASLRAYRNEMMREAERNQLKQVHEEKDGRVCMTIPKITCFLKKPYLHRFLFLVDQRGVS